MTIGLSDGRKNFGSPGDPNLKRQKRIPADKTVIDRTDARSNVRPPGKPRRGVAFSHFKEDCEVHLVAKSNGGFPALVIAKVQPDEVPQAIADKSQQPD